MLSLVLVRYNYSIRNFSVEKYRLSLPVKVRLGVDNQLTSYSFIIDLFCTLAVALLCIICRVSEISPRVPEWPEAPLAGADVSHVLFV